MSVKKISQLNPLTSNEVTSSIDLLAIVDTTNTETKKITVDNLLSGGNYSVSGSFSGSFQGDGSGITGVISEWDGSHNGNASITGSLTVTSDISSSSNIMVNALSFDGGSTSRKYIVIDIGDWNMDTTTQTTVPHLLSATEYKTITSLEAMIRDDNNTIISPLDSIPGSNPGVSPNGGFGAITSTTITLTRITGGGFDVTDFDNTPYNRGFISFWYIPD